MLTNDLEWHLHRSVGVRDELTRVLHKEVASTLAHPVVAFRCFNHNLVGSLQVCTLSFHQLRNLAAHSAIFLGCGTNCLPDLLPLAFARLVAALSAALIALHAALGR